MLAYTKLKYTSTNGSEGEYKVSLQSTLKPDGTLDAGIDLNIKRPSVFSLTGLAKKVVNRRSDTVNTQVAYQTLDLSTNQTSVTIEDSEIYQKVQFECEPRAQK